MCIFLVGMYADDKDYKDCREVEWNKDGNSLMFEDYNFPIVALVNSTEVNFLIEDVSCWIDEVNTVDHG